LLVIFWTKNIVSDRWLLKRRDWWI